MKPNKQKKKTNGIENEVCLFFAAFEWN